MMFMSLPSPELPENTSLSSVVVPILRADIGPRLDAMFRHWSDARFAPNMYTTSPRPVLLIVINDADQSELDQANRLFDAHPQLSTHFSEFVAISANLKGDRDLYTRVKGAKGGAFGARAGPNFLFYNAMRAAAKYGGYALQIELDCLPIQAGWLEDTQTIIDANARAWVIGSQYAGLGELSKENQEHLNGNALYCVGSKSFQAFLSEIWMPRLLQLTSKIPNLAYDCWWSVEKSRASAMEENESWLLLQTFDSFFQTDPFVINLVAHREQAQAYAVVFHKFAGLGRMPIFMHGPAMTAVQSVLFSDPEIDMLEAFDKLDPPAEPATKCLDLKRTTSIAAPQHDSGNNEPIPLLDWHQSAQEASRKFLRDLSTKLVLNPETVAKTLETEASTVHALRAARALLPENDEVLQRFDSIRSHYAGD